MFMLFLLSMLSVNLAANTAGNPGTVIGGLRNTTGTATPLYSVTTQATVVPSSSDSSTVTASQSISYSASPSVSPQIASYYATQSGSPSQSGSNSSYSTAAYSSSPILLNTSQISSVNSNAVVSDVVYTVPSVIGVLLVFTGLVAWSCYNVKRSPLLTKTTAPSVVPFVEMNSSNPLNNCPPLPKSPLAKSETCEEYTTMINGQVYYLDGPGGRPLAKGWRRFTDGGDVWYTDSNNNSVWAPVYEA